MSTSDSVSPAALLGESARPKNKTPPAGATFGLKSLALLFLIFVLVVSDVFTNNVVDGFRGAVDGRSPTTFGVAIQGIFLVIFFVIATRLIDSDIL